MRKSAALLCVTGVVACSQPGPAPLADAGAIEAGRTEVMDAGVVETAAPTATAPPRRRSCGDLTPDEKRALEECAYGWVRASLGVHGRRTARIEVSGTGSVRVRTESTIDHEFRAPLPGDTCVRTGELLAPLAPCTWDLRGPSPSWTIGVVNGE